MNLKKLEKMIDSRVEVEELFEFFNVKNKEEVIELWKNNLNVLRFVWNDGIGYESLKLLYEKTTEEDGNTFYQELMKESLFLRTFCNYNIDVITAFVRMIGILQFIYITRTFLKKSEEYQFFIEMYDEYKKDLRFITEWKASSDLLKQISESSEIDIEQIKEATDILGQLREEVLPKK